ncbi:MAG: zinc-dependent metalloprotease [Sphingobacteriales bacterium]|nr:zinc-dependent metalloprotease [Sphingobacteriales bacterium]
MIKKYSTPDQSYHELRNGYLALSGHYARSLNVISRYVGGVYVNRNFVGQDSQQNHLHRFHYTIKKSHAGNNSNMLFQKCL